MFFSKSATLLLALATGFASQAVAAPRYVEGRNVAPHVARYGNSAPALPAPEVFPPLKRADKKNKGKNDVEIKITTVEITEVKKGNNVAIVETVQQVLIKDSSNNKKKNQKRKAAYKKKNNKDTTVLLIVKKIVVKIADGKGNTAEEILFAQSAITANKGQKKTDIIMISDAVELIAKVGATGTGAAGAAAATNVGTAAAASVTGAVGNAANSTEAVTLMDAAPTWTVIQSDPAASVSGTAS